MVKLLAVIPARLQSTRLPHKVLEKIGDRMLLQWTYDEVIAAGVFDHVIIATDSEAVMTAARSFGAEVEMTSPDHRSGTDRAAEVARRHPEYDVIANVQGDQIFLSRDVLAALVVPYLNNEKPPMTTLATPLKREEDFLNPSVVKVISDQKRRALYFSRAPIPYFRKRVAVPVAHHLGLYAFTKDFIQIYTKLSPTPLEQAEELEQLRVLEHGYDITVNPVDGALPFEINTPADLERARQLCKERN